MNAFSREGKKTHLCLAVDWTSHFRYSTRAWPWKSWCWEEEGEVVEKESDEKKGLEKIVTLTWANTDTNFFISTVSRRGQPTGRSILAEVLRRMISTVAFSPLRESSDVHITHMHIHTFLQRTLALLACLVYPSLPTDFVCVCVCY